MLENKINDIIEKVRQILVVFKNKTIDYLISKFNNLKAKINKYMIVTEQQNQIITNTE